MRTPPIKVYDLYPRWGGFSVKTIDYFGTVLSVAATSVRQAYAVAYKEIWIDSDDVRPVGIVSIYCTGTGTTLWCGCLGHDNMGGIVRHGDGITALRRAIESHHCARRRPTLRQRLLAAAAATKQES